MIDNFSLFPREFVEGEFYYIQIMERKKDNSGKSWLNKGNSCRILKSYSIYSKEQLVKYMPSIVEFCTKFRARAMIHPARRKAFDITSQMIVMLGEHMLSNKHNIARLYDSACGMNAGTQRKWIIDIDTKDFDEFRKIQVRLENTLWDISSRAWNTNYSIYNLPTVHGFHIITKPFDTREYPFTWGIHKNNPTLLYCDL